jgi:hypothetical protein
MEAHRDEPDNRISERAVEGNAEAIVTGDKAMPAMGEYEGIRLVTLSSETFMRRRTSARRGFTNFTCRICLSLTIAACFGSFLLLPAQSAYCMEAESPWSVFAYGGKWTDTRFVQVIRGKTEFRRSYVWVAGVSRKIHDFHEHLGTEGELNIARNSGLQNHFEINGAVSLRWNTFPWDRYVNTSLAYGLGLSHAFERPPIEEQPHRRAARTIVFMPAELTFAPPKSQESPWELIVRIHHRSGAFGVVRDAGGSNFVTMGLRYRF